MTTIESFKEIKINDRYTFDDGDIERVGDISEYELIASTYSKGGNDFEVLLKHKNNKYLSIISCDEHSLIAYFYDDIRDYFDSNLKDCIYEHKKSIGLDYKGNQEEFEAYLKDTFNYDN